MFELIFLIIISGYFIQSVIFVIGAKKRFPKISEDELPTATVIVAARDEEDKIHRCLNSLGKLEYPEGKLEVLLVDDLSTDRTGEIIDEFISSRSNFRKIVPDEPKGKMVGKVNALATAIKQANGEIILTTDADCEVKSKWVKTIASYYQKDVGMVDSYTTQIADTPFSGMQAIDFIYLLLVAGGTINLAMPLTCIGNNMSFRKKAYNEIGGYESLPFSVTEDFTLLRAIYKLGKYKILFPLEKDALVTSIPCTDLKSLYHQKKRWSIGGLGVPVRGFFIMSWGYLTHLCIILTFFFYSPVWLYLIFFKIAIDFFVLYPVHHQLGVTKNLKYFWAYQIYYILYVLALPFIVLASRKVIWKGREY
ncbi:beta-monoglucosyldiacylglycerol synthase [bacterium BMS3Abin03]|nr:beta-monoglucosyldiacylglycerol synthase [bacterium BMS3Abin03]